LKWKKRIVVDSKRSGVSKSARKFERMLLPRAIDVTYDSLDLMASAKPGEFLAFLIADFKDAFYILPNKACERRFFCVAFRGQILVFMCTVQGSKAAPLTWARLAAFLTRMTQAILGQTCRMSTYVDDPILACMGVESHHRLMFAITLLLWSALRLPLSLGKASMGTEATWTSAHFAPLMACLTMEVALKPALLSDVVETTCGILSSNVVALKLLRSYAGKVMHVASLIFTVRPFLSDIYGALYSDIAASTAPVGCIWTLQVEHALLWLFALLTNEVGSLTRCYELSSYLGTGKTVELNLDASPWGMGGYLLIDHRPVAWYSCPLGVEEAALLSIEIGSSAAQQAVEALAVLIALRLWSHEWRSTGAIIRVRSDSISALVLALKLKTKGKGTSIIAREMALDIARACYAPVIAEHVPGVANVVCDALSRFDQPGKAVTLPALLKDVRRSDVLPRDAAYFTSLLGPPATQKW
jgi:hypothetical protein